MLKSFANTSVAVIGCGVEGIATAHFLVIGGARVTIVDQKPENELNQDAVAALKKIGVTFDCGPSSFASLVNYQIIVRSPGVSKLHPDLVAAEKNGAEITSQTKLFFDLCPAPIIGVTGTKGKGTTASLIFEMLKNEGKDAYLGGNIGLPPITFLNKLTKESWVVLELSSFQLLDLHKSPHIAVMLMITSEHLDYHVDTIEYVEAKRNIVRFQTTSDFAILNRDYPATNESDIFTSAQTYFVSREREVDQGCFIKDRSVVVRRGKGDEHIVPVVDIQIPGAHNYENVCAATMASLLAGVSKKSVVSVLMSFKGLEHRLELVAEIKGVRFYDDSFSTTPETVIAAIQAFEAPEILILGGSSKGSDFRQLGETIDSSRNIKAIIGIGKEWPEIKSKIKNQKSNMLIVEGAKNMKQIVGAAAKIAKSGDVVLLSPACASFDMFKNYKDRGNQFKEEIRKLKK